MEHSKHRISFIAAHIMLQAAMQVNPGPGSVTISIEVAVQQSFQMGIAMQHSSCSCLSAQCNASSRCGGLAKSNLGSFLGLEHFTGFTRELIHDCHAFWGLL